jgi:Cys-tRNA(Pro)/Cys-tRNA(Cys) deacylase
VTLPSGHTSTEITTPPHRSRYESEEDSKEVVCHSEVSDCQINLPANQVYHAKISADWIWFCIRIDRMIANNVTRMLDSKKVCYQAFELPPEKLGALETAAILNIPLEQVYKTIVVKREGKGKPILAVVPGPAEVDLKILAKAVGEKKLYLPTEREAEQITGLQAGGISPLVLINKGFQVILDSSAQKYEEIHVSGGQRGLNIRLPVQALVTLTNARMAHISDLK